MPLVADLLNPSAAKEKTMHKKKRLVQGPDSFFMDVKCKGCYSISTIFSHAQTACTCPGCNAVLCYPTGGKARLVDGTQFRRLVVSAFLRRHARALGLRVHQKINRRPGVARAISFGMLRTGPDDETIAAHFKAAFFESQRANEHSTNCSNADDASAKGVKERINSSALKAMRQQIMLLTHELQKSDSSSSALPLMGTIAREYSIAAPSTKPSIADASIMLTKFFSSFKAFERDAADDQMNDLNNRLEALLKPPKSSSSSIDLTSSNAPSSNQQQQPFKPNSAFVTAKSMMPAGTLGGSTNRPIGNTAPRSLGVNKRPRLPTGKSNNNDMEEISTSYGYYNQKPQPPQKTKAAEPEEPVDERLAGLDPKIVETIKNEIQHRVDHVSWDDVAGLQHAKNSIQEVVLWPMLRPDLFHGLLGPPKGMLLFGPPGTGKTLLGKCIASQAKATFFSISASSLTSKWVGEGEKLVRALFAVARCSQPSVIFIDEIDSLLTQRSDGEFEASRRIKTEFLVQFDGTSASSEDRILVIGATNRPQEIDEAARRRLSKRLYIPLPEGPARIQIVKNLLSSHSHSLSNSDLDVICERTDGYSGSDMANLCKDAAFNPIRSIKDIVNVSKDAVRPICLDDFVKALTQVRASVSQADLAFYQSWNEQFGSIG